MAPGCVKFLYADRGCFKMLEAYIDSVQLRRLNYELNLTASELSKIVTKAFKTCAKNFSNNVIKTVNEYYGISKKKLKQRIRQYIIDDLKIKIFSGFYRTGLTNWKARKTTKGVTYGKPVRKLRKSAFITTMPEGGRIAVKRTGVFHKPSKGRYANKIYRRNGAKHRKGEPYQVEELQKQVTENGEIESVIEPILEAETKKFYQLFKKTFDNEVQKYLKN